MSGDPLHLPERVEWLCPDDGQEWPCDAYKTLLLRRYGCDVVAMSSAMAMWMEQSRHTLVLSALQLHERFIGWIPRWIDEAVDE